MVYRNPNETMYAVYDLAIAPITFDFMHYAVMVEMARQVNVSSTFTLFLRLDLNDPGEA